MPTSFLISTFFASGIGIFGILFSHKVATKKEAQEKIREAMKKNIDVKSVTAEHMVMEAEELNITNRNRKKSSKPEQTKEKIQVSQKKSSSTLSPKQLRELIQKAEVQLARKEFEDAEKLLIKVLAFDPDHATAIQKLAYLYLQIESYAKAESLYRHLAEISSKNPGVFTNLGLALFKQKKFDESIKAYQVAIQLEPDRAARYANLGQVYFVIKELETAIECFHEAVKKEPRNIEFLYLLADACQEAKEFSKAKKWYERILDFSPYDEAAKEEVRKLKALGF